jgi:hypothetical protein
MGRLYFFEASGEDLRDDLEPWEWSDEKVKTTVQAILRERKKARNSPPPGYISGEKGLHSQSSVHLLWSTFSLGDGFQGKASFIGWGYSHLRPLPACVLSALQWCLFTAWMVFAISDTHLVHQLRGVEMKTTVE